MDNKHQADDFFLPDFCSVYPLLILVLLVELVAVMLAMVYPLGGPEFWNALAMNSLFAQWVTITSAALLCWMRSWLQQISIASAAGISYGIVLFLTLIFSILGIWLISVAEGSIYHLDWERLLRNLCISAIITLVGMRYFFMQQQWKQQLVSEAESKLRALQARIHPHFLFNSMNTIASLTRSQPELAEEVVEDLSELFRASFSDQTLAPFMDEVTLCRRYMHIEGLRFGDRLTVDWQLDPLPEKTLLPPLIIQPLLENAINHGISRLEQGGVIQVAARLVDEMVEIEVTNPYNPDPSSRRPGNGMALQNIRTRIEVMYGEQGQLNVREKTGAFCVILRFPVVPPGKQLKEK